MTRGSQMTGTSYSISPLDILTKVIRWFFLSVFTVLMTVPLVGQFLPLQRVSSSHGLSQGMVYSIFQDSKGFIWTGTKNGLNRYDGYDFRVFRHDPFDSLSLSDNRILRILEDNSARFWIATATGLDLFDPRAESFKRVPLNPLREDPYRVTQITILEQTRQGNILVMSDYMLYRLTLPEGSFDLAKLKVQKIDLAKNAQPGLQGIGVNSGIIPWSDSTYIVPTPLGMNLLKLSHDPEQFVQTGDYSELSPSLKAKLEAPGWKNLRIGKDESIWILQKGKITQLRNDEILFSFDQIDGYLEPSFANFYSFWFSDPVTDNMAVILGQNVLTIDSDRQIRKYQVDPEVIPVNDMVSLVAYDRGGDIWFGTKGDGLYKSDFKSNRFSASRTPEDKILSWEGFSVRSLFQTTSEDILIASFAGRVYRLDTITGGLEQFPEPLHYTVTFCEDYNGTVWAGGIRLVEMIPDEHHQWQIKGVYEIPRVSHPNGVKIMESRDSTLWVVTIHNLCKFDREKKTFTCHDLPVIQSAVEHFEEFPTMIEDYAGRIWIGTGKGLVRFNPKDLSFKVYQNNPSDPQSLSLDVIRDLEPDPVDPRRYLWIGLAGGGLEKFDMITGACRHFGEDQGLPDMVVYGILTDESKKLWMSTNHGIAVMDPVTETFKSFDTKDGLLDNEFNTAAFSKAANGVMLFGGVRGFHRFRPESVYLVNNHIPKIAFTSFRISNKNVYLRKGDFPLRESIAYASLIRIPSRFKSFSIEFAALDFSDPDKNQFRYKLEGFDTDWQYAGGDRSATYTNLDPGHYTFYVKASNNDGVWNEEAIHLDIVVLPPWFRTWWAFTLYALVLGGIFYFFRRKELQEQELKHQLAIEHVEAEKLKEVDQMKSRFFANISHEFRTPLTLILGHLEKAEQRSNDLVVKNSLEAADRNSKKLLELINELLDLSKLESGNLSLNRTQQDLLPFIKNILYAFEALAIEHKITLGFATDHEKLICAFDADKLEKVFANLLSNAIKFTPDGGEIAMVVHTPAANRGNSLVEITVRDNGTGIPKEDLNKIFDRFYQANNASTKAKAGTGIGLALVKEYVKLHGGEVVVKSTEGEGSSFTVRLPLMVEHTAEGLMIQGKKSTSSISSVMFSDHAMAMPEEEDAAPIHEEMQRILVVEDNMEVRAFVRDQLKSSGFYVEEAENGQVGFEMAKASLPDLILSDVVMPVMDGFTLSRHLRTAMETSHIPIILLTARTTEEDKLEGLDSGIDAYITKPFSSKELLAQVNNLVRQRRLLRDRFKTSMVIRPSEVSVVPMDQLFLEKVLKTIEERMGDSNFGVDMLSSQVHISVNHLHRKLTALIDQSPGNLIRSMRLQRAAELLTKQSGTVAEIAYEVGFSVPENFSKSFKKHFGISPSEYPGGRTEIKM